MTRSLHNLQLRLWKKFCVLIDGMAISSTVYALRQENIFQSLENAEGFLSIDELAVDKKPRPGYLHLAFRLLEDQGLVLRHSSMENGGVQVVLTASGRSWLLMTPLYDSAMDFLRAASELTEKDCDATLSEISLHGLMQLSEQEQRVRLHVVAPLVAAFLVYLYDNEMFTGERVLFKEKCLELPPRILKHCLTMLTDLGWLSSAGEDEWFFTGEGQLLPHFVPQLFYPVSYLKTSRQVPELIFPEKKKRREVEQGEESHIDRSLDIRFSGLVYERNFREPVHKVLLELFNAEPLAQQPRYIVDTGSGDGTMLLDVYRTIAEETLRGESLRDFPLTVIGVEFNQVAAQATADRLKENRIPFLTFQGDISEPEQIGRDLTARGIALDHVFHISKSVIHNRIYCPPLEEPDLRGWEPQSEAVFIDARGTLITAHDLALNLVDHFRRWRPLVRNHGMLVIEAHTVPPQLIAASIGANILTSLDSSHGYSHQYLVEKDFFHTAIRTALFSIETVAERCVSGVDLPVLTVDYLRSIGEEESRVQALLL
ncbi:MAG: hypothetical protein KKA76_02735 [Proteobacteria bacterium]|nr:hypothetical protein [Pseudomonadota bacterium]